MLGFLWDLHQQFRINQAQDRAERGHSEAKSVGQRMEMLEDRVDTLTLVNMALWSLMQDRLGLTEDELAARVQRIDLRDGRADGKVAPSVGTCSACKRTMSARHRHCMYCGEPAPKRTPFAGT
jgi:hypothetical protein